MSEKYTSVPASPPPPNFERDRLAFLPIFQQIGATLARIGALPLQEEPPKSGRLVTTGNISVRHPKGGFFITGSGVNKVSPEAKDILHVDRIDHDQRRIVCTGTGPASRETLIHAAIYDRHPSTRVVLHTHDHLALRENWRGLPVTDEAVFFANQKQAEEVARRIEAWRQTIHLKNHGQFIIGDSVEEAVGRARINHGHAEEDRMTVWAVQTVGLAATGTWIFHTLGVL